MLNVYTSIHGRQKVDGQLVMLGYDIAACTPEECVFARIDKLNREAAVIFLNKSKYPKTFKLDDYMKDEYTDPKFLRKPHESEEKTIKLSPFDYGVLVCSI